MRSGAGHHLEQATHGPSRPRGPRYNKLVKTALVHSEKADGFDYGREHPLRMERLGLTWRLMRAYGLTTLPNTRVVSPEAAAETDIARYHTREYMDVLKRADSGLDPADGAVYGLGLGDNPVFRGLWEVAQLVAAGSLTAADLVASGAVERAFHFAGGLHHAFPDRASGFCYVNDAVLAILRLREHGLRVAYIDIDAHHGDGVQHAFYADPDVLTISTHERGERLFPGTGFVREQGEGAGVGYDLRNVPRMWAVAWAVLNGVELAPTLPDAFADDRRRYGFTSRSLWDEAVALPDELRRAVSDYVDRQVDAVQTTIFPIHDL